MLEYILAFEDTYEAMLEYILDQSKCDLRGLLNAINGVCWNDSGSATVDVQMRRGNC
jgi:hypothetical protein